MARFYGEIKGQARTTATRRGSKSSGITAHIRGWNIGVRVEIFAVGDRDIVHIYRTSGSNAKSVDKLITEFE